MVCYRKERFRKELEDNKLKQEETIKTHSDAYSKLSADLEMRTIEWKTAKEVKEITSYQSKETEMELSALKEHVKDLEQKHESEMLSKKMQIGKKENDLETLSTNNDVLKEEADIMKVEFRKQQEVLEKLIKFSKFE